MKPISLSRVAQLLNLPSHEDVLIHGVAIDSRKVVPGDLFFALPGNRVDGHAFLKEVAGKGAACAIVHEGYRGESYGLSLLHVSDVLLALQEWARKSLQARSSKVIAITGSLGKTTVKEFAKTLLSTRYRVFASPLSYNSQVTVPLSILMADETAEYLILEMGMTHAGNLSRLISIAPPEIALLTTVSLQHALNFSDGLRGISREKAQIFSHPNTKFGILPLELDHFDTISQTGNCEKKTFSISSREADFFLDDTDILPTLANRVHNHNFLAARALAQLLEIPRPLIESVIPTLRLPPMRFERVEKQGIIFINDAYNANPDATKAALENLPKPTGNGKTIAVLSEMDALGMYTEAGHALVAETALHHADLLFCLGSRCETMRKIWKRERRPIELFESRAELEKALHQVVKSGDVVLLKGARAWALDQILETF